MKVLIPGGSGFLGGILTQKLVEKDIEVHVISRTKDTISPLALNYLKIGVDLTKANRFEKIKTSYDAVVYLAGISARDALVSPKQTMEINTLVPQELLTHLAEKDLRNYIYLSTQHVDALADGSMKQSHAGPGLQLYAASKLAGEILLNEANEPGETALTNIRLPNCFGLPNMKFGSDTEVAINDFCRQAARTSAIHLHAPDDQIRTFCVAESVIDRITHIVAPDLFSDEHESLMDAQFSCDVIEIAKVVCTISTKVKNQECIVRIRDENLEIDELAIMDSIKKIPGRFISEVQHLVEHYLDQK